MRLILYETRLLSITHHKIVHERNKKTNMIKIANRDFVSNELFLTASFLRPSVIFSLVIFWLKMIYSFEFLSFGQSTICSYAKEKNIENKSSSKTQVWTPTWVLSLSKTNF